MSDTGDGNEQLNALAVSAKDCRASMELVVRAMQPRLVELVRASLIHRNDRADAVQEVLIQVIKCVQGYDPQRGDFLNYAISSARLLLYREHKKNGKLHNHEIAASVIPAEQSYPETQDTPGVDLGSVPPKYREVVGDYYGIGRPRPFSINQIAARRGMTNAAVRDALREAVQTLKGRASV